MDAITMTANEPTNRTGLPPVHPGEILREQILPELGITAAEAAERTGLSPATIDALLHERRDVSADDAHALEALGMPSAMWLALQVRVAERRRDHASNVRLDGDWTMIPIGGGWAALCPACSVTHVLQADEVRVKRPHDEDVTCEGCGRGVGDR